MGTKFSEIFKIFDNGPPDGTVRVRNTGYRCIIPVRNTVALPVLYRSGNVQSRTAVWSKVRAQGRTRLVLCLAWLQAKRTDPKIIVTWSIARPPRSKNFRQKPRPEPTALAFQNFELGQIRARGMQEKNLLHRVEFSS